MVEPQSIRSIDEPKRVFPTHLSHFFYRAHRRMGFGGKVEEALKLPTVQTVFLWLVWMLRKRTAKVPPQVQSGKIDILECGMKKFFDCVFFDEESFGQASSSVLQLSVCFCSCFQCEKSDFRCKSRKNVVFGIFQCFS